MNKKLFITICIISLCVIVAGCSIEKDEDKNNDLGSGDFSSLPVAIKVLVEHAEYCKEIYDGGGDQRDDVAFDVKQKDGKSIIIIRGTANASNVESDINIALVEDVRSGIYLHKGFRDAALGVMEIIDTARERTSRGNVISSNKPKYPLESTVYVTGHSLGGAVAQIIGIWLHKRGYSVQVFSYGSPKISSQSANGPRHWRVVRSTDPVPFTPPLPYVHRGVFINSATGDWGPENDRGILASTDVTDHAIAGYVTTLKYLE